MAERLLLDACVLYPSVLREVLLGVAQRGVFVPLWSPRILAEWAHAAARRGDDAGPAVARAAAAFPGAEVQPQDGVEATLSLPDPGDAHVLAAALAGGAEAIITLNLRDFPARSLAALGLRAEAPDTLLMRLWLAHPAAVEDAVAQAVTRAEAIAGTARPVRALLKRAGLPRLGKALGAS
ncbi:RSP_2648 family PIN domain-containing protein [Rhodobaculum claviforme]|uniref:PIN domain-containing protein n=1 Tax=Rhodobaculum claviforme TaxID=1549854 RepID=A0A934WJV2_9RHOB|nr:PIN domain-containing protein [Rhodobaculum claviforme]MBK5928322.1 PIN domain-containing protein [Rhodobaculum claviforme]